MTAEVFDVLGIAPNEVPDVVEAASGVDWVSVTTKDTEGRKALFQAFDDAKHEKMSHGAEVRPWSFLGYAGINVDGLRWGTRDDSDIAMISGSDAFRYWRQFGASAENCTRIDLACTATLQTAWPGLANMYYKWHKDGDGQPSVANLSFTVLENTTGGNTCYVGSRSSRQCGRIYDKGVESGCTELEGMIWRYEVEYKKPLAWPVMKSLLSHMPASDVHGAIAGTVFEWFNHRDCPPVWSCEQIALDVEAEVVVSTDEVKLHWLSTQVSPTVSHLLQANRYLDTIKALGLYDRINPHWGGR